MLCAKAGAQHIYMCKCCAQHNKKLVVGLSYPMRLCSPVKAALSFIAAGSCSSVVYMYYKAINAPIPFKGAQ